MTGARALRARALVIAAIACGLLAAAAPATAADGAAGGGSAAGGQTRTPIRHFLMLMQEGHSFDNYFGRFPGADGTPPGTCMPTGGAGPCVRPFHLGDRSSGLPHGRRTFAAQRAHGRMNGFVSALGDLGIAEPGDAMGYYDDSDIPFYWNAAEQYVLFDRFFSSSAAGAAANHMFWLTGTPGDPRYPDAVPPRGFGSLPTIFDRLEEQHVSWKVYVQNYDPAVTFRSAGRVRRSSQVTWMPLLAYPRYLDNPRLMRHVVDLSELFTDADRGTLPSVAYVVPGTSSEHPPGSVSAGVRLVRRIVNSLMLGPAWKSSAFMWTYDNWGGWYDHVRPPRVDREGYGFRVPAVLVSAWARAHRVDHTRLDFTSALRFIEANWRLRPLARRDADANTFASAFDFTRGPREPVILPMTRASPQAGASVRRPVIYAGYGGALALALALVALTASGRLARPGRRGLGRRGRRQRRGEER